MLSCDLCGKEAALVKAEVEDVDLSLCGGCARYGKVKKEVRESTLSLRRKSITEQPEEIIVSGAAQLLRKAREERSLSHNEFAKLLNIRESLLAKWESGNAPPDIATAHRIGRQLGIKLVEREKASSAAAEQKRQHSEATLGDIVRIRKRK